ncbi:MAG: hypothetical protein HY682_10955 [Chloroflexi bacterium]|nr:hypothetical protein [Chloroflexota bacterium]
MNKVLQQAKDFLLRKIAEDRQWTVAGHVDSYGDPDNRVEFHVLEGSPPRAFIIAWRRSSGQVRRAVALDSSGKRLKAFSSL